MDDAREHTDGGARERRRRGQHMPHLLQHLSHMLQHMSHMLQHMPPHMLQHMPHGAQASCTWGLVRCG